MENENVNPEQLARNLKKLVALVKVLYDMSVEEGFNPEQAMTVALNIAKALTVRMVRGENAS